MIEKVELARLVRWWKREPILSRRAQVETHKLWRLLMPAEWSPWRPQFMNWDGYSTPHTDPKHLTDGWTDRSSGNCWTVWRVSVWFGVKMKMVKWLQIRVLQKMMCMLYVVDDEIWCVCCMCWWWNNLVHLKRGDACAMNRTLIFNWGFRRQRNRFWVVLLLTVCLFIICITGCSCSWKDEDEN